MAETTTTAGPSNTQASDLDPEQLQRIIAALSGGTRKPKIKEPEVFNGERSKLRGWLAQIKVYFKAVGWAEGHDEEKILYATSLLRGNAGTWMTPYAEERIAPPWDTWNGLADELRSQFGVIDAKGEARIRLKNMKQGSRSMTEYWNEYRLVASEAELDDATGGEWLLTGMNTELQDAWGADSEEFSGTETLARWAIRKETKLATVRHIQKKGPSQAKPTTNARNQDGTFRPTPATRQNGDPMDLDATQRRPRLNLSQQEFRRRMDNRLCLNCGKPGHRAADNKCAREGQNTQKRPWTPRRTPPWGARPAIKEMEVEEATEPSGNEECPQ